MVFDNIYYIKNLWLCDGGSCFVSFLFKRLEINLKVHQNVTFTVISCCFLFLLTHINIEWAYLCLIFDIFDSVINRVQQINGSCVIFDIFN